ncbi:hypothetical protein [Paludisphaera borealis]|nr:hypothetical protein [Paludisphaera borealis]
MAPKLLKSLTEQTLSELVRVLLVLGGISTAVLVWAFGAWLMQSSAQLTSGLDGFAVAWAAWALRGQLSAVALTQSHIGSYARETAVVFTLLGGLFGLFGGAAGGLISRSIPRTARAGAGGLLLGSLAGGASCLLVVPIYLGLILQTPDTRISIAAHALIHSAAAAACGLAAGLGARMSVREALTLAMAGVMGASLGALLFGLIQMFCFPFESEFVPIPRSSLCRLVAFMCATLVAASCIATVLKAPSAARADGAD